MLAAAARYVFGNDEADMMLRPPTLRQRLAPKRLLRRLLARRGSIIAAIQPEARRDLDLIRQTRRLVPLLMSDAAALHIQACVRAVRGLDGAMAEAGVLQGGSARLICEMKGDAFLHLFDVFDGLQLTRPAGSVEEAEIRTHFGPVHGRRAEVEQLLAPYGSVFFHPGIFPTTTAGLDGARFSFVHLDLDLPRSMRDGLAFFHPRLLRGGIIIGDDYSDPEVRQTFGDFFAGRGDTLVELPWGQVMVVKHDD